MSHFCKEMVISKMPFGLKNAHTYNYKTAHWFLYVILAILKLSKRIYRIKPPAILVIQSWKR